jgi:hypothetical protein
MMDFIIEKNVPIFGGTSLGGRPLLCPWNALEVGDSVVVPTRGASQSGKNWAIRYGRKFLVRKQVEKPHGYRVWRVE